MDLEILEGFRQESKQILGELEGIVARLEKPDPKSYQESLSQFSQKIDRIMGTAKTLSIDEPDHQGLIRIGKISALCKQLGYKAAEGKLIQFVPLFAAFWADTLEVIADLLAALDNEAESKKIAEAFSAVLQGRLEWLAKKMSPKHQSHDEQVLNVQSLLKDLGF